MPSPLCYSILSHRVCVAAVGADAAEFLRGQLTNDPPADDRHFVFAGWNDARGRVRALFHIVRCRDGLVLLTERDNIERVLEKMRMFVLRAKVDLRVAGAWRVAALLGDSAAWLAERGVDLGVAAGSAASHHGVAWLRVGPELVHAAGPAATLDPLARNLETATEQDAGLAEIRLGIPQVVAATELRYLPQMLNLDRLGGVSFTKGCYPGQEVVARLHHLGTVKRRMQRFSFAAAGTAPKPGDDILAADGAAVGEVVRAAIAGGRGQLLAVVQLDGLDSPLTVAGTGDGGGPSGEPRAVALRLEPLPYDVPYDPGS